METGRLTQNTKHKKECFITYRKSSIKPPSLSNKPPTSNKPPPPIQGKKVNKPPLY